MYLTRVYLNPYRRGCRHLVSSLQRLHAAVLASFPPGVLQTEGEGRVLWRLDRPNDNRRASRSAGTDASPGLCLYISSPAAPDPAALVEQAGYETEGGVVVKKLDDFLATLEENQVWGFRITVNPTYRRTDDDGRKRLLGHVTVAQQTQWLLDRAEVNGFQIPMSAEVGGDLPVLENEVGERVDGRNLLVSLVDRRVENFVRVKGEDKRPVTLKLATFQGTLKVTDPRALRSALANGIGRAKGYGAGLLTLARP